MLSDPRSLSALLLLGSLLLLQPWWTSSMSLHMAGQIPLLVLAGNLLARPWQALLSDIGARYRAALLLYALFTLGLWMVPRLLDAAVHQPGMALAKWISLPLAGAALAIGWRHLPAVLRGVLQLEAIATLLRLGWLYLQAPQRYCVSYGIADQQNLGYLLLIYSAIYGGLLALAVLFGFPRLKPEPGPELIHRK